MQCPARDKYALQSSVSSPEVKPDPVCILPPQVTCIKVKMKQVGIAISILLYAPVNVQPHPHGQTQPGDSDKNNYCLSESPDWVTEALSDPLGGVSGFML